MLAGTNKIKDIGTFSNHAGKAIDATKNVISAEKIANVGTKATEFGKTPLGQLAKIPLHIAEDMATEIPRANIINKLHEFQTGRKMMIIHTSPVMLINMLNKWHKLYQWVIRVSLKI